MRSDIKAGRAYVELLLKDSQFNKKLKAAGKSLKQFGSDMQAMGRTLAFASAAILVPMGMASKTFADFDDKMREVKAVTQATSEEFAVMTAHAKMLGATTSYTAVEVAALKSEIGKAGFSPKQVDDMTGAILNLARATGTDATMSAGIMAASLRQFNLEASDAARVADSLTAAANMSFNSVEALGESLSYAGPVAADFGMSIEETLAILGGLGNVGILGSNAGTAVRRLLTITGAEATKLKKIFGVEFVDAAGNARPLVDTLGEVNEATKGLGTAARAAKFNEAFGILGITGASAIAKNAASVKELHEGIKKAGGVAAATAKEMDAGFGGALRMMWSSIEGVSIELGEALAPALTYATNTVGALSLAAIEFVNENKALINSVFIAAAGIGAVGVTLFALGGAIVGTATILTGIAASFTAIGGAITLLFSPIGLLIGGLAGAMTYFVAFTDTGRQMVADVTGYFGKLGASVQTTFDGISAAISSGDMAAAGKVAMAGLNLVWLEGTAELQEIWSSFRYVIERITNKIAYGMQRAFTTLFAKVKTIWIESRDALADIWGELFSAGTKLIYDPGGKNQEWRGKMDDWTAGKMRDRDKARRADLLRIEKDAADQLKALEQAEKDSEKKADADLVSRLEAQRQKLAAARKALLDLTNGQDAKDPNETDKAKENENRKREAISMTLPTIGGAAKEAFSTFSAAGLIAGAGGGEKTQKQMLQAMRDRDKRDREWQRRMLAANQGWVAT
jgi:TP901 family phage tail tape measure protein